MVRCLLPLLAALALSSLSGPGSGAPLRLGSDEFPLGMYSVDSPAAMAQVAEMGIGYVHTYAGGRATTAEALARDRAYLDAAAAAGLKVMYNLNGPTWLKHPDGVNEMLKLVEAFKSHPALGFWYLYDEPDGAYTADQLRPYYEAVKRATPDIPVAVCTAWSARWQAHVSVLDLLLTDIYPVTGLPFPEAKLDHVTKFTQSALGLGKPVIPVNQCFNWKALAGKDETYRGCPTSTLRYPNTTELRYWCYGGLCQGVRGMFWWSYYRSVQGGYGWLKGGFASTLREFAEFTRAVAPAHRPESFERARDDDALLALWSRPGGDYLVLVNAWPLARSLSRGLEGRLTEAALTPWGSTRAAAARIENGRLSVDRIEPWEALVWKVQRR